MKTIMQLIALAILLLLLGGKTVLAAVPINESNAMYAKSFIAGDEVPVLLPAANVARLNPANALGTFDAIQGTGANERFFATASREYTKYYFGNKFWNVDNAPDITFSEVTWGSWHTEAVKVYLLNAYVRNSNGNIVKYSPKVSEKGGYYAGIAWNKTGIALSANTRNNITKGYLPGVTRNYQANTYAVVGNFGLTYFHLPEEVVYASGIKLIDVTKDVYNLGANASTYNNNTDGYDLDGIKVYRYRPLSNESATGYGYRIVERGTWFMYNTFNNATATYKIQAGNPKNKINTVGTYTITKNGNDFTASYDMDTSYTKNGYIYDIVVKNEHLAVSDNLFTSTAPGKLANQKFYVPFHDHDGFFNVFAHFEIEFR